MSLALVFPGQGAQYVGMGLDFYEHNERANAIFASADFHLKAALQPGLKDVMFSGPEETLKKTDYTQPAIFTMSCAIYEALKDRLAGKALYAAGHSLGEYSALYAAGAFSFETGIKLVSRRGALMQLASTNNKGGMAAVLGLDDAKIKDLCAKVAPAGYMAAANLNSPGQVVVSGDISAIDAAETAAKELGAKRYIKLAVAGAFHSRHMQSAAEAMKNEIASFGIKDALIPVVSNYLASEVKSASAIQDALVSQITSPVRWVESILYLKAKGVDTYVEMGSGAVLSGLIKKIDKEAKVYNIDKVSDIEKLAI